VLHFSSFIDCYNFQIHGIMGRTCSDQKAHKSNVRECCEKAARLLHGRNPLTQSAAAKRFGIPEYTFCR
jgi:hypothetical protein